MNDGRMSMSSPPFATRLLDAAAATTTRFIDEDQARRALRNSLMSPPRRVINNYHDLNGRIFPAHHYGAGLWVKCVLCREGEEHDDLGGDDANPLIGNTSLSSRIMHEFDHSGLDNTGQPPPSHHHPPHPPTSGDGGGSIITPANHTLMILPCGHLAGWECLQKFPSDHCPLCGILFRRNAAGNSLHCHHEIRLHALRLRAPRRPPRPSPLLLPLSAEEAGWLVPRDGFVAERCRRCATLESLRELTAIARRAMAPPVGSSSSSGGRCVYATDGVLHGFLDDDQLRPFAALDIRIGPPLLPPLLADVASGREEALRAHYEGRGLPAENGAMLGRHFFFRVGALARPLSE
ncbi:hypothetical protein N3K66_008493 [Trichothecium roseum]|uniref:Uncharacterized protein n=1 Tax=Trichothecium roseum TaxID=47278 RepID=A0ACC0UQC7_9HYPO|nr:hypothetical protein N3K66_008493 [Trichothecium roseum]